MIFAKREYDIEGCNDKILLQIYEPSFIEGNWVCVYELIGPRSSNIETFTVYGVDKLQAISLAMKSINTNLNYISDEEGLKISWMGEVRLNLI